MKAQLVVTLDNGVLNYVGNVGTNDAITILEAVKFKLLSQAMAGPGRPPEDPGTPSASFRSPGLQVRRADGSG